MNANDVKKLLYENNKVEELLSELGCHSIKYHSNHYWTCGNPDGDNKAAITIYAPSLNVINYTRSLHEPSDIISLVEFIKDLSFFKSLKFICDFIGTDYYKDPDEDMCEAWKLTKMLKANRLGIRETEDETPIKEIDEIILSYYQNNVNDFFKNDGINYLVQKEFEIGYDGYSNRITIPIRDELGNLCGIKGRLFKKELDENELKYIYLEPCPRAKILYGLYKTFDWIKKENRVYVGESEKFTMQLWSYDYKNCVSLGGLANRTITKTQIEKLTRLGVEIVLCLDKDIKPDELEKIADQFTNGISIYAIIDKDNILEDKESPSDNKKKWEKLVNNNLYRIR